MGAEQADQPQRAADGRVSPILGRSPGLERTVLAEKNTLVSIASLDISGPETLLACEIQAVKVEPGPDGIDPSNSDY